jgi:DedD protein
MPWPFSRSEPETTDREAGEGDGRRAESRDPAAELRTRTRRRLIGAAALLVAAVIVLPMLLDTAPRPVREDISITIASPPPPVRTPADKAPTIDEKIAEPAPAGNEPPQGEPSAKAARPSPPTPPPTTQPVPPAAPVPPTPAAAPATERFAVQVAALSTAPAAKDLVARLKKEGFGAYVETVSTADSTLLRVRVGPFASREEAQRAAERVKAAGHKATVVGG